MSRRKSFVSLGVLVALVTGLATVWAVNPTGFYSSAGMIRFADGADIYRTRHNGEATFYRTEMVVNTRTDTGCQVSLFISLEDPLLGVPAPTWRTVDEGRASTNCRYGKSFYRVTSGNIRFQENSAGKVIYKGKVWATANRGPEDGSTLTALIKGRHK